MFRMLVDRPIALFTFLSGVLASVATNTISTIVFSPQPPPNVAALWVGTGATFLAAVGWFWFGEYVAHLKSAIERNAQGMPGEREERLARAYSALEKDEGIPVYLLFGVSLTLTVLWPLLPASV